MAIHAQGQEAISFTGWQIGLVTDNAFSKARIQSINKQRIFDQLNHGRIVIIAGFQGITPEGDFTTLGRGVSNATLVAVGAVLIAYNWPKWSDRYRRIAKFVDQFFPKLAEFQKPPRHPKWKEANLAATLPGWTRFPGADEWLAKNRPQPVAQARDQFNEFMAARGSATPAAASNAERERLFQDFLKWNQAREQQR